MPTPSLDRNTFRARVFKALGHPVRMALVEQLLQGERCVCELAEACEGNMPAVSKHLAQLKEAGILESRREGTNIHYSLRMTCVAGFLSCVDSHLAGQAEALAAEFLGAGGGTGAPCACAAGKAKRG